MEPWIEAAAAEIEAYSVEIAVEGYAVEADDVAGIIARHHAARLAALQGQVAAMREALSEAIEGYEEGTRYKGEYLTQKHGDAKEIARMRALLEETL